MRCRQNGWTLKGEKRKESFVLVRFGGERKRGSRVVWCGVGGPLTPQNPFTENGRQREKERRDDKTEKKDQRLMNE